MRLGTEMPMKFCINMYFCLMKHEQISQHTDMSSLGRNFVMNLTEKKTFYMTDLLTD